MDIQMLQDVKIDDARELFNAYNNAGPNPGKTWDGKDVPPWEACGEQVQAKWRAVAAAVAQRIDTVLELDAEASDLPSTDPKTAVRIALEHAERLEGVVRSVAETDRPQFQAMAQVAKDIARDINDAPPADDRITLNDLCQIAYSNAVNKGFHRYGEAGPNIEQKLMLIVSELAEALEEMRAGHDLDAVRFEPDGKGGIKPEGFPVELADAVIRIADTCKLIGIDLEQVVALKHSYNVTRPSMHGGKAF